MKKFDLSLPRAPGAGANAPESAPFGRPAGTLARRPANAADATPRTSTERPRILFLDDEDRILNALAALFRYKYQVFTATSGDKALAILGQCHVHVVVSDQRMPGMTGVEFLRQVKAVSPNTVRILLTGFSDLSAIIGSVNDGEVYRFLNKPWGNQEIQAVIADALSIGLALEADVVEAPPAEVPARTAATEPCPDRPAVLMLHDRRETFEKVRPLLNESHPFVYAGSMEECLRALQTRSVGVIVSDLQVGRRDTSELLKVLKQEHPQILTIVVAESADADHVIELINQAKIFRYVLAPYKPQKLKFFIDSALAQFQRYRNRPALLQEQKSGIERDRTPSRTGSLIRERLRALRELFVPRGRTAERP
ncbi:MAG TPA: response regulator [Casimicrobiaceae bacterium]